MLHSGAGHIGPFFNRPLYADLQPHSVTWLNTRRNRRTQHLNQRPDPPTFWKPVDQRSSFAARFMMTRDEGQFRYGSAGQEIGGRGS